MATEVDRLVADISHAIEESDLLSLLLTPPKRSLRLRQRPKCLSEIPKSILDERVRPIRSVLETIDAQKLLGLRVLSPQDHRGPRLRDGVHCRPICDQIRPELRVDNDVAMGGDEDNHNNKSSVVRYLHIAEVPDEYTIGIFVFGPHEKIPLHDHPEMCVLSRVLYGDLRRLSLDLDRKGRSPNDQGFDASNCMDIDHENEDDKEEENPNDGSFSSIRNFLEKQSSSQTMSNNNNNSSSSFLAAALHRSANWLQHNLYNGSSSSGITIESDTDHRQNHFPQGTKLAYRNAMDTLEAPNVASLYPYEGNLHEFVAGPYGAAVLDVLLPPYDDERKRDCTFYHITEIPPVSNNKTTRRGKHRRAKTANSKSQQQQQREPCLIVPTGQPENFHCISGRYKDLGETDDYEFDED